MKLEIGGAAGIDISQPFQVSYAEINKKDLALSRLQLPEA